MARVDAWSGDTERLANHAAVKHARKREGVVLLEGTARAQSQMPGRSDPARMGDPEPRLGNPDDHSRKQLAAMQAKLDHYDTTRPDTTLRKHSEALQTRLNFVASAFRRLARLGMPDECGFDSRLLLPDRAWEALTDGLMDGERGKADFAWASWLRSENKEKQAGDHTEPGFDGDEGNHYCRNKQKCDRHAG